MKWGSLVAVIILVSCTQPAPPEVSPMALSITSPEFENNERIPAKFTCQGDDVNPALVIEGIPERTTTLVLIMDDPDAPVGT